MTIKLTKRSRIDIPLIDVMKKFGIKGKVTKFTVPSRHNFKTDEEWQKGIYVIIETEEQHNR